MWGPEAGDGKQVVADGDEEVVLVGHVLVVVAEEELREGIHLDARRDRRTLSSRLSTKSICSKQMAVAAEEEL